MAPLEYWLLRLARRHVPERVAQFLLDRGLYLKPGEETARPDLVAHRYAERAEAAGVKLPGATVCVVGYGGSYGVGLHLLALGAGHVLLQDPFAPAKTARNRSLSPALRDRFGSGTGDDWRPDPDRITEVHEHLDAFAEKHPASVDLVVSNSVLEHVEDVASLVHACARVTASGGLNVHYIDLRDHFFKYPFEMLCYSSDTWQRWLNPAGNLNRLRVPEYRAMFASAFASTELCVLESLVDELRATRPRIRDEFLTGDETTDAATLIRLECWAPSSAACPPDPTGGASQIGEPGTKPRR